MQGKTVKLSEPTYNRLVAYLRADPLAPRIKAAVSVAVDRWLDERKAPAMAQEPELTPLHGISAQRRTLWGNE